MEPYIKQKNTKYPSDINKWTSPRVAQKRAYNYLGKTAKLYPADKQGKKYKIWDKINKKWVNFGAIGYQDFTRHKDKKRRKNYLTRSRGMKGNWKANKYSANNLSIHVLW